MVNQIRNFAIIAHVDHGKSTLADRFLEITKTIGKDKIREQFLDQNPISRERGITIKLAPVRMEYLLNNTIYSLNLIDTPGHVDFSYEVSRTLACCEGAILLVDSTQGIQAQTVSHFEKAKREGLNIIPVINKIDLPAARVEETKTAMNELFGFEKDRILSVSGKTGLNVTELLKRIVEEIPPPKESSSPLRALIFDAFFDEHRGVIVYVRIFNGKLKKGDRIKFYQGNTTTIANDVGYFTPYLKSKDSLEEGEIGYIATGVKDIKKTGVGDTVFIDGEAIDPLPGYKLPQAMIFFGVYPKNSRDIGKLKDSINKIALNDTSLTFESEYSTFLGSGFRVGFLGLLHADIVKQRLREEQGVDMLLTLPQIQYVITEEGKIIEPYINLTVYTPSKYVGAIMTVCQKRHGSLLDMVYYKENVVMKYEMPLTSLVRGLSADLISVSEGYSSIDYEITSQRPSDLVPVEIRINDVPIDVLSEYAYRDEAVQLASLKAKKLKESLPRAQIKQVIQGIVNGNIAAREEIPAFRKDVLAKMSGGDRTRKDKLLEAQRKGKDKMQSISKIDIPQEALYSLIEQN